MYHFCFLKFEQSNRKAVSFRFVTVCGKRVFKRCCFYLQSLVFALDCKFRYIHSLTLLADIDPWLHVHGQNPPLFPLSRALSFIINTRSYFIRLPFCLGSHPSLSIRPSPIVLAGCRLPNRATLFTTRAIYQSIDLLEVTTHTDWTVQCHANASFSRIFLIVAVIDTHIWTTKYSETANI